jgi:uncharacterized protein YukE
MSQGAFDKSAKATAGRTTDLGGLVKQLVAAAAPLEGKFNGDGKRVFDVFKANVDQTAADLNAGMAHLAIGQKGVGTAVDSAQAAQVAAGKQATSSADAQAQTAHRFSGR